MSLPDPEGSLGLLAPLTALDTFIQELQHCDQGGKQLRVLLNTIADSVQADVVFIQSTLDETVFELSGKVPITPEIGRRLVRKMVADAQGGKTEIIRSNLGPIIEFDFPAVQSVAMIQLSKSKDTWAVALRLTPGLEFQGIDMQFLVLARRILVAHCRQVRAAEKLRESLLGIIHSLTAAIDAKDAYTCGHSERVARIAVRISREMGLSETLGSDVYLAGLLHDIGKIGIKDSVLLKPGKLTEEETQVVREHPVIGDRIISSIGQLQHVRPGVRNHHERWDGEGYPDRLAGKNIPRMARILAVADSCDAMLSARPYRPPMPSRKMESIMVEGAGSQWDPEVVNCFMKCRQEIYGIGQRGIGHSVCLAVNHAVRLEAETSAQPSISRNLQEEPQPLHHK
ncbi:MAG TPA: HD-GYP domain-containing protein [Gemmataceae bacterium]|jgi:HD-GYP domain-containing protein (c-di-GMP phosphodiesterase class II)|nr:HD-GYP domain-containing protein [Gemmataceae bacterium]